MRAPGHFARHAPFNVSMTLKRLERTLHLHTMTLGGACCQPNGDSPSLERGGSNINQTNTLVPAIIGMCGGLWPRVWARRKPT